ncbi:MAG: glycoside hydrolase family 5 protein [Terriglobia bacterium]
MSSPRRMILTCTFTLSLLCGEAFAPPSRTKTAHQSRTLGWVRVSKTQFLDASGKPLLLHGMNVAAKSPEEGYVGNLTPDDFAAIRSWGMNCIRLAIFWDGLEPQPGHLDAAYLERIAQRVEWAKAQGLYVLLDMHQDLYSVKFSDGAPAWATLDGGKPFTRSDVWSDAYYASAAVQTALDHFWENAAAPDGVSLQDHYARVWQFVAQRFDAEPAVIGYDLMNEPFPGKDAPRVLQATMQKLSELLGARMGQKAPRPEELFALEATPQGRKQIAAWLKDMALFTGMLEPAMPIMQDFERNRLMPMYARVHKAIREVDSRHIIFLEPAMSANMGIPSALTPLADESGERDPAQAYAPHGYDLVTDTDSIDLNSNDRVAFIFRRHAEFARTLKMPMLVGEWGAYYENPAAVGAAQFAVRQFDLAGCGDLYWDYTREMHKSPLLRALERHSREPAS